MKDADGYGPFPAKTQLPTSANSLGLAWCISQIWVRRPGYRWPDRYPPSPGRANRGQSQVVEQFLDLGRRVGIRSEDMPGAAARGRTTKAPCRPITRLTGHCWRQK